MVDPSFEFSDQRFAEYLAQTQHLEREGARRLAYLDLGDPLGRPVFAFHGTPGSRFDYVPWDRPASARGLRVIAPDRPGIGASDHQPGRRALDWPAEVEALACALGIERFAVAGMSGGGPAVYATAYALHERVEACFALACAISVDDEPEALAALSPVDRWFARMGLRLPERLLRVMFWSLGRQLGRAKNGAEVADLLGDAISSVDRAILAQADIGHLLSVTMAQSYSKGAAGPTLDAMIIYRDWGFSLAEICVPTYLRHGVEDSLVPIVFSRKTAEQVEGAELSEICGQGHLFHISDAGATLDWLRERLPSR